MLHVLVMESAQARAVRRIERSAALPNAHDVVNLDPPAARLADALEAAGLDGQGISSHNFRHTYASLLIVGLRLDPVGVAGQLGHSNPATTLKVYAHLFDQARHAEETRDRLAAGFGHLLGTEAASS